MWSYVDTETPLKDDHLPESNPDSSSNKCLFYCCTCATLPTKALRLYFNYFHWIQTLDWTEMKKLPDQRQVEHVPTLGGSIPVGNALVQTCIHAAQ